MLSEFAKESGVSRKIILSDGSEWDGVVTQLSADDDTLWVTLDEGPTMTESFLAFNNPANVQVIKTVFEIPNSFFKEEKQYEGFTEMTDISVRGKEILLHLRIPRRV